MYIIIILVSVLSIACTSGSKNPTSTDDGTADPSSSVNSSYPDNATIDQFNGAASPNELNILLTNSDLSCASGQTLIFDGTQWGCGNLPSSSDESIILGSGTGSCSASNNNEMRYNSTTGAFEACSILPDAATFQWTELRRIIDDSFTINLSSADCTEFTSTLALLSKFHIGPLATITLQLPDGTYTCTSAVSLNGFQLSQVHIVGNTTTPGNVVFRFNDTHGFFLNQGSRIGLLTGIRIEQTGTASHLYGIAVYNNSYIALGKDLQIDGFSSTGSNAIRSISNSTVVHVNSAAGDSPVLTNNMIGLFAEHSSAMILPYIQITGTGTVDAGSRGLLAGHSSTIHANEADISNVYRGVDAIFGSSIYVDSATVTTTYQGVVAHLEGFVSGNSVTATSCQRCFETNTFGSMYVESSQATCTVTTGLLGYTSTNGGQIYADNTTVNGGNCATNNYQTANGGILIDP